MTSLSESNPKPKSGPIVVLGGLGFMGSHICRALLKRGEVVRVFDKLYASRELVRDLEAHIEIVEGDIARSNDVIEVVRHADTVVHLVHTTVPGSSMDDPAFDITSNVVASVGWLARLKETKVRRILYFSSGGTVYGIPQTPLIDEHHATNPISSYGITKLAIEKYVAMYAALADVEHCILRPSNVYGEGQRLHIGQGVVGVLAHRAFIGEPLEIWGTGENLRDYLHVEDLVTATLSLIDYKGRHSLFNISSEAGRSTVDILAIISDQLGFKPEVIYQPARGFDVPVNVLDSSRLKEETGWHPVVGLEAGIRRTIEWLKTLKEHNGTST